ncbi:ADOP family duplicated permease [Granulicella sp. dw_53]|uniref:ADOP family duplicated permease n=1 Tax=Granulicella sp. dw_53 TaxID=2719792 RepID=UPI001BD215E2|nr:ADOP family duplicated permease [Granulicella sp. dw_53]
MFGWNNRRNQLLQEFETHIEVETRENLEAGMSPEEAKRAARKKFGNVLLAAEESREIWGRLWLERMLQDVRYAVRSLRGSPAYTATLVCTLVLGLGAATTMMAVVESILMRPVALPHPEQLVQVYSEDGPDGTSASAHALSYKAIDELRRNTHSFTNVSGYNFMARPVSASDGTRITVLTEVTPEFFPMLGVQTRLGRPIGPGDDKAAVVVVSDEFWRERLHADPKAVGSTIKVSGQLRTVIGVLPAEVHVPQGTGGPMVYLPVSLNASGEDDFKIESALTIARLKPGVSAQQALADAQSVFAHGDRRYAERYRRLSMRSYQNLIVGDMQKPLFALLGGVGVLLLIACANAANLQIGRAASRMPEIVTRSALGASFGRLLQQLISESILVSLLGAVLGGMLSFAAVGIVRHAYGQEFPRFDELSVRLVVLGCTGVLAVFVGIVASIAPLLNIRRRTTSQFNTKSVTRRSRLPGALVALQVALTCILLVISGLFVRTLKSLQNVKLGFDPRGVTTLVLMPELQNQDPELSREIEARLLRRFETLPGVQSVTMQTAVPFSSYNMTLNGDTEVSGRAFQQGDSAFYSLVSTNFVQTSRMRLLKGRNFVAGDEASSAMVALVNEAFLKKYLEGREAIGASLRFHRNPGETDADLPFVQPMTVVGVVEDEVQGSDLGAPYQPMIYLEYLQLPKGSLLGMVFSMTAQYAIRSPLASETLATEIRAAVTQEAPTMVEMSLQPMDDAITHSLGQRRLALRLVGGFGVVALALSAVGIYGVLAYSVALRRREIGIRMALGSTGTRAAALVMSQAGAMALLGLIPGIAGAWGAGYAVRSFLYGVRTFDAATAAEAGMVLMLVFAAAASFPAMRAAKVDPVETLRAE